MPSVAEDETAGSGRRRATLLPRRDCRPTKFFHRVIGSLVLAALFPFAQAGEQPFRIVGPAAGADCRTVQEAIDAVPADNTTPKLILLQPGAYFGQTVLDKPFVTLRGSGPASLLTYNLGQAVPGADRQEITWRGASALLITPAAHDAVIEDLTLENTYGKGMQAQACSVEADRVVFRRCRLLGWQDTLRLETGRQLFEQCYIAGHVDFIYGGATAYFEGCEIHCRDQGYITAPATPAGRPGFIFADCRITFPYGNPPTYLGRPWKESPQAVFIRCELGGGVQPEGWKAWRVEPPLVRFAEYQSRGPGAGAPEKAVRVTWATNSPEPAPAAFDRAAALALLAATLFPPAASAAAPVETFAGATPLEWSTRLARSELARQQGALEAGTTPKSRWDYTSGLFAFSVQQLAARTGDTALRTAADRIVTTYVAPDGTIATYRFEDFNIDMVTPGRALLEVQLRQPEERFRTALTTLRRQLAEQPRTSEGGFWHKLRYPQQMWLDGLYMGSPFLAAYGKAFADPTAFDDVARQILLVDRHLHDARTGLYYHAWDEARKQDWADKTTGLSPNFWGRSIGWYGMAIVDVLDYLPPTQHELEEINAILRRLADGIVRWQDPRSGAWWQVVDQGDRPGNYLEATASSMFVYTLAKAINRGYLPREKYLPAVRRGYEALVREFLRPEADGRVSLTRCCSVAGLGYTNSAGRARDGSFEYYVSEPIADNDLKGVGPFILAGLELEQLLSAPPAATVVRGWDDAATILARIQPPSFPARDFPITAFGAQPGADATGAIRDAIAACHEAGGRRVVVPSGEWLTGAIHLRSHVNLHIAKGATLRFQTDPAAYLPAVFTRWEGVECYNYSPLIYAFEQTDIAITGEGTLDGGASLENWWGWNDKTQPPVRQLAARNRLLAQAERGVPVEQRRFGAGDFLRPNFVQPYRCTNVLVEGVTFLRSPMWILHPVLSTNVTVRGVTVSTHGPNNDGCDPESSRDILIENCTFDTGDDCIAIKSGRNADGRRVNVPTENVIVRGCTMKDGHGGVVLGSECSGSIRNVFVEDCTMDSPNLDRALRFKTNAVRGGVLENVFMRNVEVGRVAEAVLTIDLLYEEGAAGQFMPTVRNVHLQNVRSSASPRVLFVTSFPGATIDGLRFRDCTFRGVEAAEVLSGVGDLSFRNVTIEPAQKAPGRNSVTAPTP